MKHFFISLLISMTLACFFPLHAAQAQNKESVYDKVMRTGELRCGYAPWPGLLDLDPNTGVMRGPFYDYMAALGQAMDIKIIWQEEVGFGDIIESLRTGRIDAHCSGAWTNAIRGKFAAHTTPVFYQPVYAYARSGDTRFDGDITILNNPSFIISTVDGESAATIAETDFPLAKITSMPKGTEGSQMLLNVSTGKADVTFTDPAQFATFDKNNPEKLRRIDAAFPVRLFGVALWTKMDEQQLINALNTATDQLLWTGAVDRIISHHETAPGMYIRPTMPYRNQ